MKNTCYNCQERHELCWNTCEKYKVAKAEHDRISQNARKIKATEQAVRDVLKREI